MCFPAGIWVQPVEPQVVLFRLPQFCDRVGLGDLFLVPPERKVGYVGDAPESQRELRYFEQLTLSGVKAGTLEMPPKANALMLFPFG